MVASLCFSGKASITLDRYLRGFFTAHSLTEARSLGQTFKAQRRNLCLPSPQISEENKSFHYVARYKQEKQTTTTKIQHRKQSRGCSLVRHIQSSVFALNTAYIQKKKKSSNSLLGYIGSSRLAWNTQDPVMYTYVPPVKRIQMPCLNLQSPYSQTDGFGVTMGTAKGFCRAPATLSL